MFQWGDVNLDRNYSIVLGTDENLKSLEKFGVICVSDVKHDLNAARFRTSKLL